MNFVDRWLWTLSFECSGKVRQAVHGGPHFLFSFSSLTNREAGTNFDRSIVLNHLPKPLPIISLLSTFVPWRRKHG